MHAIELGDEVQVSDEMQRVIMLYALKLRGNKKDTDYCEHK